MYRLVIDRPAASSRAADALYRAARLCDTTGQATEAIELYARLVNQHADFGELDVALFRWAWLVRQSDPEKAGALLARLRRDFPASRFVADATLQCAERAFADKKYHEAARC